jgi:hypothetical protein
MVAILGSGLAVALLVVGGLMASPVWAQGPGGMWGPGWMMGRTQGFTGTQQSGYGPGMMGGVFGGESGFGGMMGGVFGGEGGFGGMMGGMMINPNNAFYIAPTPLTLAESSQILDTYLASLNDPNLAVADVMVFDNQTYAQIVEKNTGIGVLEVLIDPTTQAVYPEMGPNMMWNQKYGMMGGYGRYGMMGGMMGGFRQNTAPSDQMDLTPEQALTTAQSYLDTEFPAAGLKVMDHASPFYGYYTIDLQRDGETVGMLSVNGYTGAVFPHTWHGKLLAEGEEDMQ